MKIRNYKIPVFLLCSCFSILLADAQLHDNRDSLLLWYKQDAKKWTDALPIGNGHLGAMIYGGVDTDHIQFNEATLWTDGPRQYAHPGAAKYLPIIRRLIFQGKQKEAEDIATKHFMGLKNNDPVQYEIKKKSWYNKVRKQVRPAGFNYDDADWKHMDLPLVNGWETNGLQGLDGSVWFRTDFKLPQKWKGKNLYVDLGKIRDQDFLYINGALVDSGAGISTKRHYLIQSKYLQEGKNVIAIQVLNYFDKGGFVGVKNKDKIFVLYPAGKTPEDGIALSRNWKYWIQNDNPPAYPQFEASYQPFGDLFIYTNQQGRITDYRRELNLNDAVASISYCRNNIHYRREYWASADKNFIAIHLTADKANAINFSTGFQTVHKTFSLFKVNENTIGLRVKVKNGVLFGISYLTVKVYGHNASVSIIDNKLIVKNAQDATLYLTAATNFRSYKDVSGHPKESCIKYLSPLKSFSYQALREAHIKTYRSYFDKFSLELGGKQELTVPTDQRILKYTDKTDPSLIALYVQYARYLLLSCSPPNGMAANLQGIWNVLLTPPWGSKFTTNINLEMNYWPSEVLNLSACSKPLFRLIQRVATTGKLTAKINYDAPGWVEHHNTDIWGATAPIDASDHGVWVGGSAWLCHQLWEHYQYTQDTSFLRNFAYPIMKTAAEFYTHFLIKDPKTGYLISSPSNSPEHGGLVAGPTMDHQLIRDLFKHCILAEELLNTNAALKDSLKNIYKRIAPNKIGRYGQLQEWMQDIDDSTDTHRHVSHLWGVFPGTDIRWNKDSAMMRAARQSLIYRGDGGTGWSLAWKVNLWARFKEGNHCLKLLNELLRPAEGASGSERGGVYHNMFDAHPPFQIDGNFGGAAGVAEMLLQSQNGYIELLPALPSDLPKGKVDGICARGGFQLDFSWENGQLQKVKIFSSAGEKCIVRYKSYTVTFNTKKGMTYNLNNQLQLL
ncbi:glycoside hydrolase family 95 protein [Arachidicoccus soli]|uniref:Glycoside hydrolase family 95 protein n=1 Tax=Arachidicoccus soli TaxID=2341117 RepID=A0A386HP01_9BACT|nr:glycoside hydrolase N-terminal domain-containing protein [Arachidicoccus soli]AYD47668.1 glycoside hydrolase family 95 protein [Arachidicoccus soli]